MGEVKVTLSLHGCGAVRLFDEIDCDNRHHCQLRNTLLASPLPQFVHLLLLYCFRLLARHYHSPIWICYTCIGTDEECWVCGPSGASDWFKRAGRDSQPISAAASHT